MLDVKIIKVLSNTEIKLRNRFSKYLNSPYFNVNQEIISLFSLIEDSLRTGNLSSKSDMWNVLYPETSYSDKKMRILFNRLLTQFENFLAQEKFQEKKLVSVLYKLEQVRNDKYEVLRNQILKEARTLEMRYHELSADYHHEMFLIENMNFFINFDFQRKQRKSSKQKFSLTKTLHHLDVYYIAQKLRMIYIQIFWEQYFEASADELFKDEILRAVNIGKFRNEKLLVSYYYAIRTLTNPEKENYYSSLKEILQENFDSFNKVDSRFLYDVLLTYTIRHANKGKLKYQSEILELYKDALEREVIIVNNVLSPVTFRNIVFFSLRVQDFDWAEEFIENYAQFLPKKERENAINFNLARLHFYKEEYGDALVSMNRVNLDDLFYDLNGRTLLVALYYELNEIEPLLSSVQAFKNVLKRKKLAAAAKARYNNYLKITQKLALVAPRDKTKLRRIKEQLADLSSVNKPWLREKIEELSPDVIAKT